MTRCRRHALTSCEECHGPSGVGRLVWFTPDITSPIGGHIDELDAMALTRLVVKNDATAYAAYTMGQLESRDAIRALEAANTALTVRLAAAEAALAAVHDELYSNASVSLEFAVHDLTSKRHHTEKTVGLVNEAQQSIWRAVAAARAPRP